MVVNFYIYITVTCVVDLSLDLSCLYDSSKPLTEAIIIGQRCKRRDLVKAIRSQRHRYPSFRGDEVGYFGIYLDAHAKRCSHVLDIHTIGRTTSSIHAANILQHYDIGYDRY